MAGKWPVEGFAIVSADDRIADAAGRFPETLRNDADWTHFQRELDRADLVVLGRASHLATPNACGRRRLVLSRAVAGLERRDDAHWWNPGHLAWSDCAARLLPAGGRVAVPGGQGAFDAFALWGFDAFHLSRVDGVLLPNGRGLFARVESGVGAETCLSDLGLAPGARQAIDPRNGVSLTIWRNAKAGED